MSGAVLGNYIGLKDLIKNEEGEIVGAILFDYIDNKEFKVNSKVIVNCTGTWSDELRLMDDPKAKKRIIGSRGVHLIMPEKYTPENVGLLVPKTKDGRVMFFLPFKGQTLAGTTDHVHQIDSTPPSAPPEDVKEITNELSNYFNGDVEKDVKSAWCGIRP